MKIKSIKSYLILLVIISQLVACSQPNPTFNEADITLIPQPSNLVINEGSFQIDSGTKVIQQEVAQQKAINYLVGLFQKAAGYELQIVNVESEEAIVFENVEGLKKGAYELEVNPKLVSIKASEESGFFNAVQTLRQLLPAEIESKEVVNRDWFLPSVQIKDQPRFEWRGMHMDFSRHFFDMDEVKDFLDYMALYKLNTYHMHLTDDQGWRIEIKKYPLLTKKGAWRIPNNQDTICMERAVENELYTIDEAKFQEIDGERKYGGFFTQDQIKEIVAYADDRCITVIPEIDMPGHFKAAIDNYPFLSCDGISGWGGVFTFPACVGKDSTYKFMENILSEVVELFPAEYVHIGGDEVNMKSWENSPICQEVIKENNLKDEHELQSFFNRNIERFLQSKGKQLMGWDEIVTGGLTKSASVMWWRNWHPEAPKMAAKSGNKVVVTTTAAYYFDYLNDGTTLERVYNYEPIPEDFTAEEEDNVLGIQANLWSERIPSFKRLQYQTFPRMLAVAENAWAPKTDKDFSAFNTRVEGHYGRLDELGVYYYIPVVEGLKKEIVIVDETEVALKLAYPLEGVEIFYTLDGTVPTRNSQSYTTPIVVEDTGTIKARAYRGAIFNDLKSAEIKRQQYRQASNLVPENSGLQRWVTKEQFEKVEDIQLPLEPQWSRVDSISLAEFEDQVGFSMVFKGFFKAEKDDIYEFEIQSDGGSLMFFEDDLVVDNGGYHGPRKRYGKVALKKGWHPISVYHQPSHKPRMIKVWYGVQGEALRWLDKDVVAYP